MEGQSVYSTNIRGDRCIVDCLAVSNKISMDKFVVDTGAKFTCCNYRVIDGQLKEEGLLNCEERYIGGLVKGQFLKFL